MKKQKILTFLTSISLLSLPLLVGAASVNADLSNAINGVVQLGGLIAVSVCAIFIVVGGFQILMAGGNPENVSKGRQTLLWAIVGLVIVLIAWGIAKTAETIVK